MTIKIASYPKMRVKMTLNLAAQNKALRALSSALGITETYPEDHIIYVEPRDFGVFMFELSKLEDVPTIKQLHIEWVDMKKEPRITHVMARGR